MLASTAEFKAKPKVHKSLSPKQEPDMVTHAYKPSTRNTEEGGALQIQMVYISEFYAS